MLSPRTGLVRFGDLPGVSHPMACPLLSGTSDEHLPTTAWLYTHVPTLVWKPHVLLGDLLYRGARRQLGARGQRVRGTRQLFGASHSA
jgi:hypothetical protein